MINVLESKCEISIKLSKNQNKLITKINASVGQVCFFHLATPKNATFKMFYKDLTICTKKYLVKDYALKRYWSKIARGTLKFDIALRKVARVFFLQKPLPAESAFYKQLALATQLSNCSTTVYFSL